MKCLFQNQITLYYPPFADQKGMLKTSECLTPLPGRHGLV